MCSKHLREETEWSDPVSRTSGDVWRSMWRVKLRLRRSEGLKCCKESVRGTSGGEGKSPRKSEKLIGREEKDQKE